jgi:uncharacterized protein
MANTNPPTGPVDLDALDAFLNSDLAPDESMGLSDLDGFLAGLAVSPELIMPSEWLPVVWGSEEPDFESVDQAQAILGVIMARYNEIVRLLDTDPDSFDPVFWSDPDDEDDVIVTDWAAGFLEAVRLRPDAWEPLIEHPSAGSLFVPILLLGTDLDEAGFEGDRPTEDEMMELLDDAPNILPVCVAGIHAFWKDHRNKPNGASGRAGDKKARRRH